MRRNVVAWAALVVGSAALLSNMTFLRPTRAVQEIPAEGQRVAEQLSSAFNAVADFAQPSVVQITTEKKVALGPGMGPNGPGGRNGNNRFFFRGPDGQQRELNEEEMKKFQDQFRKFFDERGGQNGPNLPNLDELFKVEPQQQNVPGIGGTGSGFVFDDKGHILTNNHVVTGADKITVTFHDGKEVSAKLVAADSRTDVAVIQVEETGYRPLPLGNSDNLKVGDWVLAVGSPFGLDESVTAGIVSAKGRGNLGILGRDGFGDFLQTDAAINPGNSGGPLIDMRGRVVGVNSAIATASRSNSGVGFTIPINFAAEIANRLIKDGKIKRAQIGILFGPVTDEMAEALKVPAGTKGVVVGNVLDGSPADKAGLHRQDVITSFEGEPIKDTETFRKKVAASPIGSKVALEGFREGKPLKVELTLGDADEVSKLVEHPLVVEEPKKEEPKEGATASAPVGDGFGLEVQALDADLAKKMGFDEKTKGVLVVGVKAGSPAAKAGVEVGNVIDQAGKAKVATADDLQAQAKEAKELLVRLVSPDGGSKLLTLKKGE